LATDGRVEQIKSDRGGDLMAFLHHGKFPFLGIKFCRKLTFRVGQKYRGQSFTDNDTGMRYRGPDDLASALQNANPNRFQTVPLSQYIQGVDY
jgi:hypothetical protein